MGVNFGVSWPAFNALIAAVTTGETRQQYFGVNFALVNLGIGVGGIIGGLYADVSDPTTFTVIFLLDGASMLVPIALLLGPLRRIDAQPPPSGDDVDAADAGAAPVEGYLTILRNPAVVWLTVLTFLGTFIGYGQMEAGLPGVRPRGQRGLDAGHRLRLRGQHRRHRRACSSWCCARSPADVAPAR